MQVHLTARPSASVQGVRVLLLPFSLLPAPSNTDDAYM